MADDTEVVEASAEEVAEARALGWAPKESWRGATEKWVDAKQFLEKGMGIHHVRDQNQKLSGQLTSTNARLTALESALQAANTTIKVLEDSHADDVKEQVDAARKDLKDEIARASRDGDHEGLADATVKLTELNTANKEAGGGGEKTEKTETPQLHPEVVAWYTENPDLIKNPRWRAMAGVVGAELREKGETAVGKAFLDLVAEEVDKVLGTGAAQRGHSKVEGDKGGSGRGGSGNGGGAKTYADLPADAKAACDKQAARLVGPNRAHKDVTSWRTSYAKQYFSE